MRLLLDENLQRQLVTLLASSHEVTTIQRLGWDGIKNGDLIRASEGRFDALLTADQNIYFQQNLTGVQLAILVLPTNRLRFLKDAVPAMLQSLARIEAGQRVVMDLGSDAAMWPVLQLDTVLDEGLITKHVFTPRL